MLLFFSCGVGGVLEWVVLRMAIANIIRIHGQAYIFLFYKVLNKPVTR